MSNQAYIDREQKFKELMGNWPKAGDIITGLKGKYAYVEVENQQGKRTMFTYAVIDDECTGWYLDYDVRGVVCMIDEDSHQKILDLGFPEIMKLRVLRRNQRRTALICEIPETEV